MYCYIVQTFYWLFGIVNNGSIKSTMENTIFLCQAPVGVGVNWMRETRLPQEFSIAKGGQSPSDLRHEAQARL